MELQRQRRLAKHASGMNGTGSIGMRSSGSRYEQDDYDPQHSNERDRLLPGGRHPHQRRPYRTADNYEQNYSNEESDRFSQFANDISNNPQTNGDDTMSV